MKKGSLTNYVLFIQTRYETKIFSGFGKQISTFPKTKNEIKNYLRDKIWNKIS